MTEDAIQRVLGRIEGKLDALVGTQAAAEKHYAEKHKDHEAKIDDLSKKTADIDNKMNRYGGGLAVLVAIVTFFGDKIRHAIFGS